MGVPTARGHGVNGGADIRGTNRQPSLPRGSPPASRWPGAAKGPESAEILPVEV